MEIEIHIFICKLSKVNDQFKVSVSKSKLSFINSISSSLWLLHKKVLDKNSKVLLTMNNELQLQRSLDYCNLYRYCNSSLIVCILRNVVGMKTARKDFVDFRKLLS